MRVLRLRALQSSLRSRPSSSLASIAHSFWDNLAVKNTPTGTNVTLAGSPLKTPTGKPITIPLHKSAALAQLIAHEWSVLPSLDMKNYHIPLTSLVSRALDITPDERESATLKLLPYLDTDTLVVYAPSRDCRGLLRAAQLERFPPVVADACKLWGIPGLSTLDTEQKLFGNFQTDETKQTVKKWIDQLDNFKFASLELATASAKSLVIAANLVQHLRSVEELAQLASLDVTHQTDIWGEVEDTHDVDFHDLRRRLGTAYVVSLEAEAEAGKADKAHKAA